MRIPLISEVCTNLPIAKHDKICISTNFLTQFHDVFCCIHKYDVKQKNKLTNTRQNSIFFTFYDLDIIQKRYVNLSVTEL